MFKSGLDVLVRSTAKFTVSVKGILLKRFADSKGNSKFIN